MTQARNEQVNEETTPYYHCRSRCVRRAFLCGTDKYSKKNFDHRRKWIVDRLMFLGSIFAIDVLAYAVMANHWHLVLALQSERAAAWSASEVVARFGKLFPMAKTAYERMDQQQQAAKVEEWRKRLSDMSWMMRGLNEWVARKANKEDGCTGRFWEGRFKSDPLLDESGLLACMAYVDLNQVRAGECDRLEDAEWTSIGARLKQATAAVGATTPPIADGDASAANESEGNEAGLVPFADQVSAINSLGADVAVGSVSRSRSTPDTSATVTPIPMGFVDYIELLEWTGRCRREHGPSGVLKGPPPAILSRLKICPDAWHKAMTTQGLRNRGALGREDSLCAFAAKRGRTRVTGRGFAATLFPG